MKEKPFLTSVTLEAWVASADRLLDKIECVKRITTCETETAFYEDGVSMSPITPELWRRDVGLEHNEHTCYFRRWFRKENGKAVPRPFSHLALMPLVRSAVWQALLYEYVTGKLLGMDAVRNRVEDELEHHSNLSNTETRQRIAMLAQSFFGIVKNHLHAKERPLNRAGIAAAEKIVICLPGLDMRSKRKGWSNRKLRRELANRIVDAGIGEIQTRKAQELFIYSWISCDSSLKESAVSAIVKLLKKYVNPETGECIIKPWNDAELLEIKSEAQTMRRSFHVASRVDEISYKLKIGQKLTSAERKFKSIHKELFIAKNVTLNPAICNISKHTDCRVKCNNSKFAKNQETKKETQPKRNQKSNHLFPSETYGDFGFMRNGKENQPKEAAKNQFKNVREQNAKRKVSIVTNQLLFPNANNPTTKPKRNQKSNHPFPSETYGDFGLMHNKEGKK